jgi:23S rRNA (adenine2503-C2)-methyltransferase
MNDMKYPEKPLAFFGYTLDQLKSILKGYGKEQFRAQQLYQWAYQRGVTDPEQMTNLSKDFRADIPKLFHFELPKVVENLLSVDGTRKLLFDVDNGKTVEAVLIPSPGRLTLCVSSEVGCNMGCRFCFTGKQKMQRRLETHEIVGQFLQATKLIKDSPEGLNRITNIVFMGMGEPLDNPEAVFGSIEVLHSPWGMNISKRRITVSTSGLVDMIPLVAKHKVRLAVSLNATTNEIRDFVMPINKKWNMASLLDACKKYADETGNHITFEYVLLKGVTDSLEDARRLKKITRHIPSKINIIPFNEHPDSGFVRPPEETIRAFHKECMDIGMHVLRRKTMGRDIYAACGQLRSKYEGHPEKLDLLSNHKKEIEMERSYHG